MAKLIALYKTPSDKQAFDAHYTSTHAPLAKKMPGLKRFEVSTGPIAVAQGESPYYFVAVLEFDSLDAIKSALDSPEGQATAGDLSNFAQAGVELMMFDTKEA
ncbi:EthD family reductase [Caballeronia sp. LZ062]|uniref:EthD family reductase n=1 Tax=unclassified Caballeronia TaxID=2646786 RepID=UPI0028678415|nr:MULTISPECIES: EthD family reductase [unclassified Caballeronia]MDR5857216.1 EthD family reductase [Caballeronia sp. LZ050]MDR5869388.1 EthD family reductase [Caballeronia sp. LZ062]